MNQGLNQDRHIKNCVSAKSFPVLNSCVAAHHSNKLKTLSFNKKSVCWNKINLCNCFDSLIKKSLSCINIDYYIVTSGLSDLSNRNC